MVYGKLESIPAKHIKSIEKLSSRKSRSNYVISLDIARILCSFSLATGRQIAILLSRSGDIEYTIVGSPDEILIPVLSRFRLTAGRLRGLRLVHTHPSGKGVDNDDLTDMALLRLDSVTALNYDNKAEPIKMETAYLLPDGTGGDYTFLDDRDPFNQKIDYLSFIEALDDEILKKTESLHKVKNKDYAVLTGCFIKKDNIDTHMAELSELARSAQVEVAGIFPQKRNQIHPKYVIGTGALREIVIKALWLGAEYIIFDNELSPSQVRAISDFTELKIIDRTQLILDIFAKRAKSNDGKLRVELAQLKYIMPRLSSRDDALSRLTGGIGGRGPGETKLEIDKRRISDRISFLSKKLKDLEKSRNIGRAKRKKEALPVVSIIGYTNAGKSTLLNKLTNSSIYADNLLFATLDTSSKRIRFPQERDVIITDTVGFIRDLPSNLAGAFKSTLEEIGEADLFLHVVDANDRNFKKHIKSVESVLIEMGFIEKERIIVFNKIDLISDENLRLLEETYQNAVFISAFDRSTFATLLNKIQYYFFKEGLNLGDY